MRTRTFCALAALLSFARTAHAEPVLSATYDYGREDLPEYAPSDESDAPRSERRGRFMIDGFRLAAPDQLDAGSCLYMAGTGILEWLISKRAGIAAPRHDTQTDLSERYLLTLASRYAVANNFTDVVYLFKQAGSYVLDRDLRFKMQNNSTQINWQPVDDRNLPHYTDIPSFSRRVLFTSNGNQYANNVMTDADIERIKTELRTLQSPVLFVFKPGSVQWWHANVIVGYDDEKGVFLTRDSSFGAKRYDLARYGYGTASTGDDQPYVDLHEMPYGAAKQWGNHASIYYLAQ